MENDMHFTYKGYRNLIKCLQKNDYQIVTYLDQKTEEKQVILRHDVDNSLKKAAVFAEHEQQFLEGKHSTYYILMDSDFYNIASKESRNQIDRIIQSGHDIGLHFDEMAYEGINATNIIDIVETEAKVMREILGIDIKSVSMHRPSKTTLDADYHFETLINSYSKEYFNNYKYLSDSRMYWREDAIGIIKSQKFSKLHILTHPFWYADKEYSMKQHVGAFISSANGERYESMKENIRDIDQIISKEECR